MSFKPLKVGANYFSIVMELALKICIAEKVTRRNGIIA